MALTEQRGIDVALYVDVSAVLTLVGALRNVQLTVNSEVIDASHAGNAPWRVKLANLLSWSISAGTVYLVDLITPFGDDPAWTSLRTNQRTRAAIPIRVDYPDGSTEVGSAIITQMQLSAPYDGVAEGSVTLEGANDLAYTLMT
ncbi:MAG: hypothetical protein GY938_12960 [Ketobacter sp.]|nr:hypothetical protein [Ketobacter sp.]